MSCRSLASLWVGEGLAVFRGPTWGPQHLLPKYREVPHPDPPPQAGFLSGLEGRGVVGRGWAGAPCLLSLSLALLQVFYPRESFSHPYSLRLLCEQVRAPPTCNRYRQATHTWTLAAFQAPPPLCNPRNTSVSKGPYWPTTRIESSVPSPQHRRFFLVLVPLSPLDDPGLCQHPRSPGASQVLLPQGSFFPLPKEQQAFGGGRWGIWRPREASLPSLLHLHPWALQLFLCAWLLLGWSLALGPGGDHLALTPDPQGHLF